jgi:hypothetical protein
MPFYASPFKVTHDPAGTPTVLVDENEYLIVWPELSGGHLVQAVDRVNATGQKPFARGNEFNKIEIGWLREFSTPQEAEAAKFGFPATVPRTRATISFESTGGSSYYLADGMFTAWLARAEGCIVYYNLIITGGVISFGAPAGPGPEGLNDAILNLAAGNSFRNAAGDQASHLEKLAIWTNTGTGDNAAQGTDANRPTVLIGPGLYLSGVSGNYFGFAASSSLHPGTTFAVRWDGILPSYTPASRVCLISKWITGADQRSWAIYLEPTGKVTLAISTDGTAGAVTEYTSALPLGISAGSFVGIGIRKTGTQLAWSAFPSLEWTDETLFSPTSTISNLDPANTNAPVHAGSTSLGTADLLQGLVQRIQYFGSSGGWGTNSTLALLDFTGAVTNVIPAGTSSAGSANAGQFTQPSATGQARFDGSNDSMALATPVPLNAVDGVTVAFRGTLNLLSGTQDLIFCGTNSTDPRMMLRYASPNIELHVRRLDGEATAVISAPLTGYNGLISASIDYQTGVAFLYLGGDPVASDALTSGGGPSSATDSSETRIMAGQGGANPAAGDLYHVYIAERFTTLFEHTELLAAITAS